MVLNDPHFEVAEVLGVPEAAESEAARHRLPKQRSVSRGSTVLGVAAMAAAGASGVAVAQGKPPAPVSMPDATPMPDAVPTPGATSMPETVPAFSGFSGAAVVPDSAPVPATSAPRAAAADPGETLVTRILAQAGQQASAADQAREAEETAARAKEAAARKVREEAARKKAEEVARQQAAEQEAARSAAARQAELARGYVKPLASYTPGEGYGQAGSPWAAAHTGQDFAAPTGTPAMAVHSGVITSAGWAGAYGYRVVLRLDDGTELWYCHLSSMVKTSGPVTTGEVIGRVGATGNVTGPHLHLEVRPGGGAPVDPRSWLAEHGLSV